MYVICGTFACFGDICDLMVWLVKLSLKFTYAASIFDSLVYMYACVVVV
jgi:hypothetical protein